MTRETYERELLKLLKEERKIEVRRQKLTKRYEREFLRSQRQLANYRHTFRNVFGNIMNQIESEGLV